MDVVSRPLRGFVLRSILLMLMTEREGGVGVMSLVERLCVGLELGRKDSERCHGDVGAGTDLGMDHHPVVEPVGQYVPIGCTQDSQLLGSVVFWTLEVRLNPRLPGRYIRLSLGVHTRPRMVRQAVPTLGRGRDRLASFCRGIDMALFRILSPRLDLQTSAVEGRNLLVS
jgi:hypothetical protein